MLAALQTTSWLLPVYSSKIALRQLGASLPRLSMTVHNNGSYLYCHQIRELGSQRREFKLDSVNISVWSCLPFLVGFD